MNDPNSPPHDSGTGHRAVAGEGAGTLTFFGGTAGALAPFAIFLAGVSWLGLAGAPDETGFWPIVLGALVVGLGVARDRAAYAEAVIDGMSRRLVMVMVLAWMLAGVLGTLLRESGLVESLVWATGAAGLTGGGFVAAAFLVGVVFSTATGTSLGTLIVCVPLLYPAGAALAADPAFLIGALIAGATFGDNVSPISDTTIASATTQRADLGGVVRSRLRYAVPSALVSLVVYAMLGGASAPGRDLPAAAPEPVGLLMLLVPAFVLTLLVRRRHLVEGLVGGIVLAALLGIALGRFAPGDLLGIDRENFIATGLVLDGMRRAVGVSVFTILLMGLVGGLEASGLLHRAIGGIRSRATGPKSAEWSIFGAVSAATALTTHSTVAIITVGELTREVGGAAGVGPYRRANILDVVVCTYPFILPFFIPVILAASLTAGAEGMPRVSPWEVGMYNAYSIALLVVIVAAIATGWGRDDAPTEPGASTPE